MEVVLAVKEFLAAKRGLSPFTLRMYKSRLAVFAQRCESQGLQLQGITARSVRAFLEDVSKRPGLHAAPIEASTLRCYATDVKNFLA